MNEPQPIIETTREILDRAVMILSKHPGSPEVNQAKKLILDALSYLDDHLNTRGDDEILYDDVNWDNYEN